MEIDTSPFGSNRGICRLRNPAARKSATIAAIGLEIKVQMVTGDILVDKDITTKLEELYDK